MTPPNPIPQATPDNGADPGSNHGTNLVPAAPGLVGRRLLLGLAGLGATAAGLGVALWHHDAPGPAPSELPPGFWDAQWDTPQGTSLAMRSLAGKPLLLNFWATWCPPCVEELPLIDAFYVKNKDNGWQVLGLAVDKLQPVQQFLQKKPLGFPVAMAGLAGTELSRSLGNISGSLPFTIVLGAQGTVLHRKLGRVTPQELDLWSGLK